jgi:hypothetical protein
MGQKMMTKLINSNTQTISHKKTSNAGKYSTDDEFRFSDSITKLKNKKLLQDRNSDSEFNSEKENYENIINTYLTQPEKKLFGLTQDLRNNNLDYSNDIVSTRLGIADILMSCEGPKLQHTTNAHSIDELESQFNSYLSKMRVPSGTDNCTWQFRYIDSAMNDKIDMTLEKISAGNLLISLNIANAEQHSIKLLLSELNTRLIQKGWKINTGKLGVNHLIQPIQSEEK